MNKIYIFGAGELGRKAKEYYGGEKIKAFIDNNTALYGSKIDDISVIGLDEYKKDTNSLIVIAVNAIHREEIKKQLEESGITNYKFFFDSVANESTIIRWGYDNESKNESEWNEAITNNNYDNIRRFVESVAEKRILFSEIEIETINRCNGRCSFCPVNVKSDIRKKTVMTDQMFKQIIDELANIDYRGRISLFSNNEPLLDVSIISKYRYVRERLPLAFVHIYTNGTLLTLRNFEQLIEYVDEFIVDCYSDVFELKDNLREIKEYVESRGEIKHKFVIWMRKENEILTSRGGEAPNRNLVSDMTGKTCALPFQQMIIRPTGEVSLCCNDPYGKYTLGDVNKNSLVDIWFGEQFTNIRKNMVSGRENLEKCSSCDTFIMF